MSSRKKGKKSKGQTIALTEFLAPGGVPTVQLKSTNWADDVEDEHEGGFMSRSSKEPVVLPTAPRAARGPGVDEENIPTNPPYVAYISNLPYDVIEEDLAEFFEGMEVSNMRLPKDSTKLRGYGYVEFADRQSFIEALSMSSNMIKARRVRIEVSNSSNDDRRGGGGRMGMGRDNRRDGFDDPERTSGDWRSKPREEPSGGDDRFRSRGSFERRDERESNESDNKPGGWREGDRSGSAFGERRGFRDDERRGGFKDDDRSGSAFGERRTGGGFREDSRRGFRDEERRNFRDEDKERDYSRERNTGGGGGGSASTWRSEAPARSNEPPASAEPRMRPKLNLQPRTKPVEPIVVAAEPELERKVEEENEEIVEKESASAPTPVPAANIFGSAKPVDTAAREREIEERLAKASAEKSKSDDGENKVWTKRNGEGRGEREKEKPRPTWRSDDDKEKLVEKRQDRHESRGPTSGRSDPRGDSKGYSKNEHKSSNEARRPSERERRSKDREDGIPSMPKATEHKAPNFVASNKYSMLHEDDDADNIDD